MNKEEKQFLMYLIKYEAHRAGYAERVVHRISTRRAAYEALRSFAEGVGVLVPAEIEDHEAYILGVANAAAIFNDEEGE